MDLINYRGLYESVAKSLPEEEKERIRISGKGLVLSEDYDRIDVLYPSTSTERYIYTKNSENVLSIEVTYTSSSKKDLLSVVVL